MEHNATKLNDLLLLGTYLYPRSREKTVHFMKNDLTSCYLRRNLLLSGVDGKSSSVKKSGKTPGGLHSAPSALYSREFQIHYSLRSWRNISRVREESRTPREEWGGVQLKFSLAASPLAKIPRRLRPQGTKAPPKRSRQLRRLDTLKYLWRSED